jgi:hypothetical protein
MMVIYCRKKSSSLRYGIYICFNISSRYLIIVDDVWSKSAWEKVRCALPQNNQYSRLLTTTRIESVAKSCCSNQDDRVYKIELLDEFHAKVLFFKRRAGGVVLVLTS